jgi:branched-chain amino acid transport system ATP-binding protein
MALFALEDVTVSYGGLRALAGASVSVDAGQILGLIGPNGAGKSTLFNVATGLVLPGRGRVLLDGVDITRRSPHARARLGLARTFQQLELFGVLTVHDNLLIAGETRRRWTRDDSNPRRDADAMLERLGLASIREERADHLPTGLARLVEVGRSLMSRPRVLLLDEPAAGLIDSETHALGALLREVAGEGLAIVLVEHDMELVMPVCAVVTVLDQGRVLASGTPDEVRANEGVIHAYLGMASGMA